MAVRFLRYIQQDLKWFWYMEFLLMVFRVAFLVLYSGQVSSASGADIGYALWLGFRISLKTAAFLTAVPFILATVPGAIWQKWPAESIRFYWGCMATAVMTLLFMIRIPYYQAFQSSFNIMIFNGLKDDGQAIWQTMLQQYQLVPRLAGAVCLAGLCIFIWYKLAHTRTWIPSRHIRSVTACVLVLLPVFAVFCRFGGGFSMATGVPWESAARTPNHLLNEAVLDDGQALYRAYSTYRRAYKKALRPISAAELQQAIVTLGGNAQAHTIDEAFTRQTKGPSLAVRPRQVVLILGENYALWPLLSPYRSLGLAKTGEFLEANGAHTYQFLADSNGTIGAVNALVLGIPDVGMYPNYVMGRGGDVDQLGIGAVMKRMGYKTVFWYGGMRSWQDVGAFSRREGFDEFHGADEMSHVDGQSSWGVSDESLFQAVRQYMAAHPDEEDTFHFILTTTNHPPFSFDVDSKGFPRSAVQAALPPSVPSDTKTMDQLGHIWYADQAMGRFIQQVQQQEPSALFVVTGDHAERFNFAQDVPLEVLSGIPCYIYGDGVSTTLFDADTAGSHLQIAPTLAELILPEGSTYESLLPPLMRSHRAFNHRLVWADGVMEEQSQLYDDAFQEYMEAARTIAIWRITRGTQMP